MSAFLPNHISSVCLTILICICIPLLGFQLAKWKSIALKRGMAWGITVVTLILTDQILLNEPAGFRMLAIIGALLYAMKTVIYLEYSSKEKRYLSVSRWIAFHLWFGMRPSLFMKRKDKPFDDAGEYVLLGIKRFVLGAVLLILSESLWKLAERFAWNHSLCLIISTSLLLVGLSFMLHFGIFNIVTGVWRYLGFDCQRLFRNPFMSKSLNEFWSRRWNLAFSEMTALGVYRPLVGLFGKSGAVFTAFLGSGLLHELAISLPVRQGFGLPLLYFLIHGLVMRLEYVLEKKGNPIANHAWLGRLWTMSWLIIPIPILFHHAFLKEIIWPLIGINE